jgi:hypothetical protein
MKSIVFLALVAAAVAHFPYADLDDKFRQSSLIVASSDSALRANIPFAWQFAPINNQLLPTFQLRFPNLNTDSHPEGTIYTVALDHLAEVLPTGTGFSLVPASTISFSGVSWYFDDTYWWYDEETFGEVITFSLVPWNFEWDEEDFPSNSQVNQLDNWLTTTIWLSIYPDSSDDLVDISIWFDGYHFLEEVDGQQLALFFKVVSSIGETYNQRNVPLAIDFEALSFELDSEIYVSSGGKKRVVRANATSAVRHRKNKLVTKKVMEKLSAASAQRKARSVGKRQTWAELQSLSKTTGQLWISGGYVATVIGLVPDDIPDDAQLFITVTLGLREERS